MIITRTPFRITLGGGGTDLPAYYSKHGGFILSAGINKYMYISVNRPAVDDRIQVKYSISEAVANVDELKHDIAKEALRRTGIEKNIEITSMADLPSGAGLGSSSCYAVGLLRALHALNHKSISAADVAEEDFEIEANILQRPIGKQDPYLAAFGGLTVLDIANNGKVTARRANVAPDIMDALNHNLLVFYTGVTRRAETILTEQSQSIHEDKRAIVESMHKIKELGYQTLAAVEAGDIHKVGELFHTHWQHKKTVASNMTNEAFDKIYEAALANGALGGKISGAGGGGFFTFYVDANHATFRKVMSSHGLRELRYRFDTEGSKVIADF